VYSHRLETLTVKLYDFCKTAENVKRTLTDAAVSFIRGEEGEKKAESAFYDGPLEDITVTGWFLRNSEVSGEIEVWNRSVVVCSGWFGSQNAEVKCEKKAIFNVTEASLGLPIETVGGGTTKPAFKTAKAASLSAQLIAELTEKLAQRNRLKDVDLPSPITDMPTRPAPLPPVLPPYPTFASTFPVTPSPAEYDSGDESDWSDTDSEDSDTDSEDSDTDSEDSDTDSEDSDSGDESLSNDEAFVRSKTAALMILRKQKLIAAHRKYR